MKTPYSWGFNLLIIGMTIMSLIPSFCSAAEQERKLHIISVLGTEATVPFTNISSDDDKLTYVMENELLLRIENNIFLIIPRSIFIQAEFIAGKHVVTLSNGNKISGRLVCSISDNEKEYSLSAAKKITVLNPTSVTENEKPEQKSQTLPIWELHIDVLKESVYKAINPQFVVEYGKYNIVGSYSTYHTTVKAFYIKMDNEDVCVNPDDFIEIKYKERNVNLTTQGGIVTNGELFYKTDDKTLDYGYIVMDLVDNNGIKIVLTKLNCTMNKLQNNKDSINDIIYKMAYLVNTIIKSEVLTIDMISFLQSDVYINVQDNVIRQSLKEIYDGCNKARNETNSFNRGKILAEPLRKIIIIGTDANIPECNSLKGKTGVEIAAMFDILNKLADKGKVLFEMNE